MRGLSLYPVIHQLNRKEAALVGRFLLCFFLAFLGGRGHLVQPVLRAFLRLFDFRLDHRGLEFITGPYSLRHSFCRRQ